MFPSCAISSHDLRRSSSNGVLMITTDVSAVLVMAARFLSRLGCLPDLRGKEMPTVTPCYDSLDYPRKLHVKHYEFHLGFFLKKVSLLLYDCWSLHEI